MRAVSLLVLVACGLSASVAPDLAPATGGTAPVAASTDGNDLQYRVLQRQADLALHALRAAQERRRATAQLAAN